jgi:uncharacterized protein
MIDIIKGILLFNDNDFFSAHDFFEDIWMGAKTDEKLFFQGLVQISVGCYHLICGNIKGAESQLNKGIKKLENFEPEFNSVNIEKLVKEISFLSDNVDKKNIIEKIPKIELTT